MTGNVKEKPLNLEVIGAGLWRTGTASLCAALEQLFGGPCYHMFKVLGVHKQSHINRWIELFENKTNGMSNEQIKAELAKLLQGYQCCLDAPCVLFYKELMEMCPNAKVVLTVRDNSTVWATSARSTVSPQDLFSSWTPWTYRLVQWCYGHAGFKYLNKLLELDFAGTVENYENTVKYAARYEDWIATVKQTVPSNRLLVFNVKQGWTPLCDFLKKPTPNTLFPKVNERENTQQLIKKPQILSNLLLAAIAVFTLSIGLFYFLA